MNDNMSRVEGILLGDSTVAPLSRVEVLLINLLGNIIGEQEVRSIVSEAIAEVIDSSADAFDILNDLEDWLETHEEAFTSITESIASSYDSTHVYSDGDYCTYNYKLYKCIYAMSQAEAWTDAHWSQVNVIEELKNSITSDSVAPEFSTSASYTAGSYAYKNGVLYRFTQSHSGAWTGTDAEVVTVGKELTDLNADLTKTLPKNLNTTTLVSGSVIYRTGGNGNSSTLVRTGYINVENIASIKYTRIYTSATNAPTWGMAFYSDKSINAYISGQVASSGNEIYHYELDTIEVPEGAKYARFTWNPNYGEFAVYDASQYNGTIERRVEVLETPVRWADARYKNSDKIEEVLNIVSYVTSGSWASDQTEYTLDRGIGYVLSGTSSIDWRASVEQYNTYGITAIDFYVYIPDASKISSISFTVAAGTYSFTTFTNGWNKLRGYTLSAALPSGVVSTYFRVTASLTENTKFYFAKAVLRRADKANIIIVQDGGYSTFLELAYPTLKSLNAPVTWALNPGRLGADVGDAGTIFTQAQIDSLADDGNSEFSFHCWNATQKATASMTPTEIQDDVAKCLHYLKSNGICPNHVWRAAHAQNNAPSYAAEIGMVEALATNNSLASADVFPFRNRWNVPRIAIHQRTNEQLDTLFETLEKTHSTAVVYTHGINDSQYNMSPESFAYFADKLEDGITNGWLRPTTYSRLVDTPSAWLD